MYEFIKVCKKRMNPDTECHFTTDTKVIMTYLLTGEKITLSSPKLLQDLGVYLENETWEWKEGKDVSGGYFATCRIVSCLLLRNEDNQDETTTYYYLLHCNYNTFNL